MKSWPMFLVAVGFLLIAVSPQLPVSISYVIAGLALVLFGIVKLKKKKDK